MKNPSGYALGFIIYHTKHERVYVSYKILINRSFVLMCTIWCINVYSLVYQWDITKVLNQTTDICHVTLIFVFYPNPNRYPSQKPNPYLNRV